MFCCVNDSYLPKLLESILQITSAVTQLFFGATQPPKSALCFRHWQTEIFIENVNLFFFFLFWFWFWLFFTTLQKLFPMETDRLPNLVCWVVTLVASSRLSKSDNYSVWDLLFSKKVSVGNFSLMMSDTLNNLSLSVAKISIFSRS